MNPYAQAADQFSQELGRGVGYANQNAQMLAQQPLTLFDRFMSQYQRQYQQKMAEQEMARKQQHEDTYLQMAENADKKNTQRANAQYLRDLSENFDEEDIPEEMREQYREDWVRRGAMETDMDEGQLRSILPQGKSVKKWSGAPMAPDSTLTEQYMPAAGGARIIRKKIEQTKAAQEAAKLKFKQDEERAQQEAIVSGRTFQESLLDKKLAAEKEAQERRHQQTLAAIGARGSGGGMSAGEYRQFQADLAREKLGDTRQSKAEEGLQKAHAVIGSLKEWEDVAAKLYNHKGLGGVTGLVGGQVEALDLSSNTREARGLQKHLEALNVMNVIKEMKAMSRTGATGWGAVNKAELEVMFNTASNLYRAQDEKTYKLALEGLIKKIAARRKELEDGLAAASGSARPSGRPGVGSVEDGYRFNGGDPRDKANWTKVQ